MKGVKKCVTVHAKARVTKIKQTIIIAMPSVWEIRSMVLVAEE
jgi:hypothetical protein